MLTFRTLRRMASHLFIATSSSPTSPPLVISMPTTGIMAAGTKFNERTENVDNKVVKLEGGLPHVRIAKAI